MANKKFSLTEDVDACVLADDRNGLLNALVSVCFRDRNFSTGEFDDGLQYVTSKYPEEKLYDASCFPEYPLYAPKIEMQEELEQDAFPTALTYLRFNFCKDRIADTRRLGQYLYPESTSQSSQQKECKETAPPTKDRNKTNPLLIAAQLVAVVAAAVAVILFLKHLFLG